MEFYMEDNKKDSFFDYDEYVNEKKKGKSNTYNSSRKKNRKKKKPNKPNNTIIGGNVLSQAVNSVGQDKISEETQQFENLPDAEIKKENIVDDTSKEENAVTEEKNGVQLKELTEINSEAEETFVGNNSDIIHKDTWHGEIHTSQIEQPVNKKSVENKHKKKKHKPAEQPPIESLKKMLDEALDEDVSEIAELASESVDDVIPKDKAGARRRFHFILGLLFTFFAIVGFCSSVVFSVNKISYFVNNTKQKNDFAKFIYPIVICDPAPFDQTVKLRNDTVITAAIWDIILYEDKSKYTSEFDNITVPALDVEQHAEKLFGSGLTFKHESIIGADVQFYYEEDIKSYVVPLKPKFFTYSPVVENITNDGNIYTLLVGYISPTPAWLSMTSDTSPEPDKYVKYIVSRNGDDYTLISIQQTENQHNNNSGL